MVKAFSVILLLLWLSVRAGGQVSCFAKIALDRHSVYVQQPFRVTITVLTATWYTAPLAFDNIRLPNAFVLPFDQTTPGMFDVGGKQYAGLQFYFIVFPYSTGTFVLPAVHIVAHTPSVGESMGRKVSLTTAPQQFTVKPVPAAGQDENWFVAKNVAVSERWSRPPQDLKVGDIIERTVTIRAAGTLPQFIPPLQGDSLAFAGTYLQDAELRDERNDYDANGSLTQSVVYLLEKEGDFVIPAIGVTWWNPNSNKVYIRHAPAGKIHVKANADLGMLTTLRDSLDATTAHSAAAPAGRPKRNIPGIVRAIVILLAGLFLLYRIVMSTIKLWDRYKKRHALYLSGESYAFRRLMASPPDPLVFLRALYRWWDRLSFPGRSLSISWWIRQHTYSHIPEELDGYFKQLYALEITDVQAKAPIKSEIKKCRKHLIRKPAGPGNVVVSKYQVPVRE